MQKFAPLKSVFAFGSFWKETFFLACKIWLLFDAFFLFFKTGVCFVQV